MPSSTFIKNNIDGSLVISDGTGTPLTLTVPFEQGNFTVSGLKFKLRDTVAYQTRGVLSTVRHTVRNFPSGSFSAMMSSFTSASANSLSDIVLKNGFYASAISTLGASADVYTLKLAFTVEGTNFGDSADHSFSLGDCECNLDFAEGDPNLFTISFVCYGAVLGDLAV